MTTKAEFLKAFEERHVHFTWLREELETTLKENVLTRTCLFYYHCDLLKIDWDYGDREVFFEALMEFRKEPEAAKPIVTNSRVSGRAMQRNLVNLGIPAQKIIRSPDTGDYVADFYVPDMSEPVAPAEVWADRIKAALPNVVIVATHNTRAYWRPNNPCIYASVIFHLEGKEDV